MISKLVLLRHGATAWSEESRYTSRTDLPLSPAGVEETRNFAPAVVKIAPTHVWRSPSIRCEETLDIIRTVAGIPGETVDPCLGECDFGTLEGLTPDEAVKQIGSDHYHGWRLGLLPSVADIESYDHLEERAGSALDKIIARTGDGARVFIVSHGYFIRAVLAAVVMGLPASALRKFRVDTCHGVEVERADEQWRLCGMNVTAAHWL